jgi:hypothetical protein
MIIFIHQTFAADIAIQMPRRLQNVTESLMRIETVADGPESPRAWNQDRHPVSTVPADTISKGRPVK